MQKILKMIENEEIDVILICKLDRLSRSLSDIVGFIDLCLKHKVDLVSIKENIDMTTSMGRMFVYMMGVLAQFEREQISERTINGLKEKAKQGFYPHGNKVPYGFQKDKNHKLEVVQKEAEVIKEAMKMYAYDNKSEYDVSEYINEKYGKYFSPKNLRVFLEKPIHQGIVEVGGEEFAVVEPIFSSDDLQAMSQRRKLNIYSKKKYKYRNRIYINNILANHETTIKKLKAETKEYVYYRSGRNRISEVNIDSILNNKIGKNINEISSDRMEDLSIKLITNEITKMQFDTEFAKLTKKLNVQKKKISRIDIVMFDNEILKFDIKF